MNTLSAIIASIILWFTSLFGVTSPSPVTTVPEDIRIMKDVGEASMPQFGLSENDFIQIKNAQIDVIEGNFDICASDEDVTFFLDEANKAGLKVIMNAGSGEAEWGYECNKETYPRTQKPVWQKEAVVAWVTKWKNHPSVYAWDISNEAGSVFPNASWYNETNSQVPDDYYLTANQLKAAYSDVKNADPSHPIMIRMNGWFFYDEVTSSAYDNEENFFRPGNPFDQKTADIVMVNAYSNVEDYYEDFVSTVTSRSKSAIGEIDPNTAIVIALGAWEEKPLWFKPSTNQLLQDIETVKKHRDLLGISFFKYGAKGSEWYLPEDAPDIWNVISSQR